MLKTSDYMLMNGKSCLIPILAHVLSYQYFISVIWFKIFKKSMTLIKYRLFSTKCINTFKPGVLLMGQRQTE